MQNASQKKSEWRFLHSEWRFLHSNFSEAFSTFFLKILCKLFSRNFSPFRMEKSPFRMEKSPFTFFEKRFHHFFCKIWKCKWKTLLKKKWYFSILNGDFSIHFFFRSVLNFLLKKKRYRIFSPFKIEKSPYWMEISPCFSEAFLIFFLKKKHLQGIFSVQNGEISVLNEDFSIHFFQKRFDFLLKNKLHKFLHSKLDNSLHSELRFLHSCFFSEVVWTLKKKPTDNVLHSIFFRSVLNFFF